MSTEDSGTDRTKVDLDALADTLARSNSIVDSWLKSSSSTKKLPTKSIEYNEASLARPPRLGIGAKPEVNKQAEVESIFGNYRLKMQLTGKEQLGKDSKLIKQVGLAVGKRPAPVKPLRPVVKEEEESRSQSVGKKSNSKLLGASSQQHQSHSWKKRKKDPF